MTGQYCPLRKADVDRGTCNTCNEYFRDLGVYPFLTCLNGHSFKQEEAECHDGSTHCPVCHKKVAVPDQVTPPGACCSYIICSRTCDWVGNPNRCNLARDPVDASKFIKSQVGLQSGYPIRDPKTGKEFIIRTDEYTIMKREINNHEVMNTTEEEKKEIAKKISDEMVRLKFTHTGSVDVICEEISQSCTNILRSKHSGAKVVVTYTHKPKPTISITSPDSVTAWLLNEVMPYVRYI